MILVDTSVWIDHLRQGVESLVLALQKNSVCIHPMVIGELACGHLKGREKFLQHLNRLPTVTIASHDEVMFVIERHSLMGKGIGFVDAHLLAAALLSPNTHLFSRDKRLATLAGQLGIGFSTA